MEIMLLKHQKMLHTILHGVIKMMLLTLNENVFLFIDDSRKHQLRINGQVYFNSLDEAIETFGAAESTEYEVTKTTFEVWGNDMKIVQEFTYENFKDVFAEYLI